MTDDPIYSRKVTAEIFERIIDRHLKWLDKARMSRSNNRLKAIRNIEDALKNLTSAYHYLTENQTTMLTYRSKPVSLRRFEAFQYKGQPYPENPPEWWYRHFREGKLKFNPGYDILSYNIESSSGTQGNGTVNKYDYLFLNEYGHLVILECDVFRRFYEEVPAADLSQE